MAQWGAPACELFAQQQRQNYTFLDLLASAGYDLQLFGRFDVGAGVLDDYPLHKPTGDGFHGGPTVDILARGANIPGATKEEPLGATEVNDTDPYAADQRAGASTADAFTWLAYVEFVLYGGCGARSPSQRKKGRGDAGS